MNFKFSPISLCLGLFLVAGCATPVRNSFAYRSGGVPLKNPEEVALIVKTGVPLSTIVRVFRIDHDEFPGMAGGNDYRSYMDLQRIEFFELSPGKHTMLVTIDGSPRTTSGNPWYSVTKQIEFAVQVEAGKQYVLWGDVWKDGSKVGLSAIDDFCVNDYCKSQISSPSRLDSARKWATARIAEYWMSRDQVTSAPLAHGG